MPVSCDDGDSNPNPTSAKPEWPPLHKKSKTVADHAHTPLLPAVRRLSASPPPSSSYRSKCDRSATDACGFSDRDWMFPSFLGPHAARKRVIVKASKSHERESSPATIRSTPRSTSMPSKLEGGGDKKVDSVRWIGSSAALPLSELTTEPQRPEEEKGVKRVLGPLPGLVPSSLSSSASSRTPSGIRTTPRFISSWILNSVSYFDSPFPLVWLSRNWRKTNNITCLDSNKTYKSILEDERESEF